LGIGDWGLGIGDWGLGIGPNPQSPIPNPHLFKVIIIEKYLERKNKLFFILKFNLYYFIFCCILSENQN